MQKITYSECRQKFTRMLNKVSEDHAPLLITRERGEDAVLMSLSDFNAYAETAYLMSSANNAAELSMAINDLDNMKNIVKKDIIE
ncbi:type II toxin-antitoxin system prevent-host-death family antitoxin [Fangia hongkongensis]|uniref:type II toxin-antitoxin system prevent-host-death family antitoxin n=1 Tax=Fangia hongkongensis TaxID=270495 RepID=UPI00037A6E8A|nr:type II toxin-antitoxin system prevent-host-death family antitoxin [Fangia hongkongensis]MBK2123713.1 type II toxin-antitoxin system prevent-host-death family antitoxin [Fangia hongkongensis]